MDTMVKAIKSNEGTQGEREEEEEDREMTAFRWKAWNTSFQRKQRINSKNWKIA